MRRRTLASAALSLVALLAACGGESPPAQPAGPPTAVPTATPYTKPPAPTIVTGSGALAGGGSTGTTREVTYKVEAGDTLIAIASRFDTTVEAIMRRNNITNAADLKIGQELVITTTSTLLATATPAATASPAPRPTGAPAGGSPATGAAQTYTVEAGDTAFDIARKFGITLEELAAANNRTVASLASLQLGDKLSIPRAR